MPPLVRGAAAFLVGVAAFYFVGWMAAGLLSAALPASLAGLPGFALGAASAFLGGRWVWRALDPTGSPPRGGPSAVVAGAVTGALLLGGIGFVGGFFGPMVLAPEANQGPLLGLLITGPGGLVLGAVAGGLYALQRSRPSGTPPSSS
jgi:hypothetical protein